MKEVKALVIKGLHHWGFSIRVPLQSAAGKSYPVPPPSTIIGALAKPYCVNNIGYSVNRDTSCTIDFIKHKILTGEVKWITYGLIKGAAVPYSDISRELRSPYKQSSKRSISDAFGVAAFGKTYSPSSEFIIIIILGDSAVDSDWVKLSWQITSIGSKESLITITNVGINAVNESVSEFKRVVTYFPTLCIKSTQGLYGIEEVELTIFNKYNLTSSLNTLTQALPYSELFIVPKQYLIYGGSIRISKSLIKCDVYNIENCPECGDLIVPSPTALSEISRKLFGDN